jgi:signal transduction histidine kinase
VSDSTTSSVIVSIEDNGIGLSKTDQSNLFQPFKQVQRMAGGTALGLYTCICIYVYIYIYMHTHIHIYMHIYKDTSIYMYM